MTTYTGSVYDEERALYGSTDVMVEKCRFDGPADGESALKESRNVVVRDCYFNLRYPLWHITKLDVSGSEMSEHARAALWYSREITVTDTGLHGIKALRECSDVVISGCDIRSPEFGWFNHNVTMKDSTAESEYFMLRSDHLQFERVTFRGKYSFQYISDSVFEDCVFDTKDAFWHAKNVLVRNSVIRGEYLAWYCENVVFENCTITGTQPLCYCKGLKLINCRMEDADLSFEKSEVDAEILTDVISIKNPRKGIIRVPSVGTIIMDDPLAEGQILIQGQEV